MKYLKKKPKEDDNFSHRKTATVFPVVFAVDVGLNGGGKKKLSHWSIQPIIDHTLMITVPTFSLSLLKKTTTLMSLCSGPTVFWCSFALKQ